MNVRVSVAAPDERHILENLLQLYLHDFSEFDGGQPDAEGLFYYPYLALYWEDPDRYPFLIRVDGVLAGFVLVKKGSELAGDSQAMDVAEFFILRSQRRRGVGGQAFAQAARLFPGPWQVRVMDGLASALAFWGRTIPQVAAGPVRLEKVYDGDQAWLVFRFEVTEA